MFKKQAPYLRAFISPPHRLTISPSISPILYLFWCLMNLHYVSISPPHHLTIYLTYFIFVLVFDESSLRFDFHCVSISPSHQPHQPHQPHQSHRLIASPSHQSYQSHHLTISPSQIKFFNRDERKSTSFFVSLEYIKKKISYELYRKNVATNGIER